jgi:hypothetical protein
MAGAIAGTAILHAPDPPELGEVRLHTVTLTINNRCNLSCPHCYLQYRRPSDVPGDHVIDAIFQSSFQHLAIVGKEPLIDTESQDLCSFLARKCEASGRTISMVTNGHGLHALEPQAARRFGFIDVSLDGGARTYGDYRGGSFDQILSNVQRLFDGGFDRFNALHVLNERTISSLDDMLAPETVAPFRAVMLQPYIVTRNEGVNRVSGLGLKMLLSALASNAAFREEHRSFLLVDCEHIQQDGLDQDEFLDLVGRLGLADKVRFFPADPLLHGFLRVTYDGYVLAPLDSLHPALYPQSAVGRLDAIGGSNLDDIFAGFFSREVKKCLPM